MSLYNIFVFIILLQMSFQFDSNRIIRQKSMPFYSSKYLYSIDYACIPKLPVKNKNITKNFTTNV